MALDRSLLLRIDQSFEDNLKAQLFHDNYPNRVLKTPESLIKE